MLTDWTTEEAAELGTKLALTTHHLGDLPLFGDEALASVLDRHPRAELQAYTTDDSGRWAPVETGDTSGRELMRAIAVGQLWLNVLRVDRSDSAFGDLQDTLFGELRAAGCTDLEPHSWRSTLLVSSPTARVPYHADAGPNVLWHVRGKKRVFVYPRDDYSVISRSDLEDIYVAQRDEYLPYDRAFDGKARAIDLDGGQVVAWPQNSPHRVENVSGVNVSLSCEYATERSRRREYTMCGNWFTSRRLHLPVRSTAESGIAPAIRRFAFKVARRLRLVRPKHRIVYMADFVVDADSPGGVAALPEPVPASFSTG